MILVTGGTGFIGQALVKQLVSLGRPVRLLINPSNQSPRIPRGISVDVAISGIQDERNLRAAMKDVTMVYHLIGSEWKGINAEYAQVDVQATQAIAKISTEMKVERLLYLSHLGADKNSAYALLQAKAQAEAAIIQSGIPYKIIRSAVAFGEGDHFTNDLARYVKFFPWIALLPGVGDSRIQPIWIDDLITCMLLTMESAQQENQIIEIGGMEMLSFRECLELIMKATNNQRNLVGAPPVWLRSIWIACEQWFPHFPPIYFWADYLAEDRITALDTLPREFSLIPTRMEQSLSWLQHG